MLLLFFNCCRSITRAYYRNSVGGLLLFDITNRRSFQNVHDWLEEARSHVQPHSIVFLLVGHKCDLEVERQVRPRGKIALGACLKHGRLLSLAKSVAPKIERRSHLDHSFSSKALSLARSWCRHQGQNIATDRQVDIMTVQTLWTPVGAARGIQGQLAGLGPLFLINPLYPSDTFKA